MGKIYLGDIRYPENSKSNFSKLDKNNFPHISTQPLKPIEYVEVIKEIEKPIYIETIKEIIKEVEKPIEVIKEVIVPVDRFIDKEIEVIKEKIVEVPIHIEKEVIKLVKESKYSKILISLLAFEFAIIVYLLMR